MMLRTLMLGCAMFSVLGSFAQSTVDLDKLKDKLTFYGDFRFRGEHDWDSKFMNGTFRKDRSRMRIRARFGLKYKWNDQISFGLRLRSGVPTNIQSPHFNLGYKGFTSNAFQLDKFFLKGKYKKLWWWMGKNSLPFWKQNELWWDDDVIPEGVAVGAKLKGERLEFKPTLAYFIANHDHDGFVDDGTIASGQLALAYETENIKVIVASAYMQIDNIYNVPEADFLFTGTRYRRDYKLVNSGLQFKLKGKRPLTFGFDHMMNLEDYDADSMLAPVFRDQKTGMVGSVLLGQLKEKGDWLIGYYVAYKEEMSLVSYYGEDDWVRWGNINRNRNVNYAGSELRLAYAFDENFNAVLRAYNVHGLVTTGTSRETGNRVRLEFNISF